MFIFTLYFACYAHRMEGVETTTFLGGRGVVKHVTGCNIGEVGPNVHKTWHNYYWMAPNTEKKLWNKQQKYETVYYQSFHNTDIGYRVRQNKTPQHEMREYFCTKFCSFVQYITAHESVVSCYINPTQEIVTETAT